MKKIIIFPVIIIFCFFISLSSYASDIIHIVPGPLDGCRILTPWGDFVAVQSGSTIWIGTENEYEHARVKSIFNAMGDKEVKLECDDANTHSFVSRSYPSVSVGTLQLHSISIAIIFGVGPDKKLHRPYKPPNTEYVSIVWVQSDKNRAFAHIYDVVDKKIYKESDNTVNNRTHFSEFIVPKKALTHKMGIVFTAHKQPPGYLSIDSIADAHYRGLIVKYKKETEMEKDDMQDLEKLHQLNPNIPIYLGHELKVNNKPPAPELRPLTKKQVDSIVIGDTYDSVISRFGVSDNSYLSADNNTTGYEYKLAGKKSVLIVIFDAQNKVIDKIIK